MCRFPKGNGDRTPSDPNSPLHVVPSASRTVRGVWSRTRLAKLAPLGRSILAGRLAFTKTVRCSLRNRVVNDSFPSQSSFAASMRHRSGGTS